MRGDYRLSQLGSWTMAISALVLIAASVCFAFALTRWVSTPRVGRPLPVDQAFLDQDGRAFRWSQLSGRSLAVAFFYSRCRDSRECSVLSAKFAYMQHRLPRKSRLVEVTLDPAYDTPKVLRRYGTMFGQDPKYWTLATGDPVSVLTFARRFNIAIAVSPKSTTQLEHGETLAIFDRQQRLVSLNAGNDWQPEEALAQLRQSLGQPNNTLDRLMLLSRRIAAALQNVAITCGRFLSTETIPSSSSPPNLVVSAKPPKVWPVVPFLQPGAPPRIVQIWFSTLTLRPGIWFDGTIVVSSNVASVEVRTASFSINSEHVAPGVYKFHMQILELPPLARRHAYELYIIARNTPGVEETEQATLMVE